MTYITPVKKQVELDEGNKAHYFRSQRSRTVKGTKLYISTGQMDLEKMSFLVSDSKKV